MTSGCSAEYLIAFLSFRCDQELEPPVAFQPRFGCKHVTHIPRLLVPIVVVGSPRFVLVRVRVSSKDGDEEAERTDRMPHKVFVSLRQNLHAPARVGTMHHAARSTSKRQPGFQASPCRHQQQDGADRVLLCYH
eukprot:2573014-Rhodomonas_salina.2